jgi:pyruvate formate lyase activating enzyme
MHKARYYQKKEQGKVQCQLCPHNCLIAEGKTGICQVRLNRQGELTLPFYGKLSALAIDPIEKKPLYHFYPGRSILSLGFWGCSFRCPFCQNYQISQVARSSGATYSPEQVVQTALEQNSVGIAYTYSEPLVHLEYVLDMARLAREKGLKNVLVSNGYINPEPATELLTLMDAANIDLKAFNEEFYHKEIGGKLGDVKRFLEQAAACIHLEVTTLVIPTKNDAEAEIEALARFLASLNPAIPYHLSCYYPTYQYTIQPTEPEQLDKLAQLAARHLTYVYQGNVGFKETNTYCPVCHTLLIKRTGYRVTVEGLVKRDFTGEDSTAKDSLAANSVNGYPSICSHCHTLIPIRGLD